MRTILSGRYFILTFLVVAFAITRCHSQEPVFYTPLANDTLYHGDSAYLDLNAPRYPAHSGKYWSLVLVSDPGLASEKKFPLLDTVRMDADTSSHFRAAFKVPMPLAKATGYALALEYHPSLVLYYSGRFFLSVRPTTSVRGSMRVTVPIRFQVRDVLGRMKP